MAEVVLEKPRDGTGMARVSTTGSLKDLDNLPPQAEDVATDVEWCGLEQTQSNPGSADLAMRLAQDGTAAFSGVAERLGGVRALQVQITQDLNAFAELATANQSEHDPLANLIDSLAAASTALRKYIDDMSAKPTLDREQTMMGYLAGIRRHAIVLDSAASLTRTTAAFYNIKTLDQYLDDLRRVAKAIGSSSSIVERQLADLKKGAIKTLEKCRHASRDLEALKPVIAPRHAAIAALGGDERRAADKILLRAQLLADEGKRRVKTFVSAIQFSDRLAQRLDHLGQMMCHNDPHVEHLAAAHALGMAEDIDKTCAEIRTIMEALSRGGHSASEVFNDELIATTIEGSLALRGETIAEIVRQIAPVTRTVDAARHDAANAKVAMDAAADHFAGLAQSAKQVTMTSVNSTLLASRMAEARSPLTTISMEVRETATRCLAAVGGSQAALNALHQVTADAQDAILDAGAALEASLSSYAEQTARGEERLKGINVLKARASETSRQLFAYMAQVLDEIESVEGIATELRGMACDCSAANASGAPDPGLMTEIWETYTMDEEREIHARIFADFPGKASSAKDAGDDDLDDILF